MKLEKKFVAAVLTASMTAAASALLPSGEALCAHAPARPYEYPARADASFYQNSGMRLFIPKDLDRLLLTETPRKTGDGRLFSVYEKASIAAAEKMGMGYDGAGWIFAVGWVDEAGFREMICRDMTGVEIFARDGLGNRYLFYHPTDVRYFRADNEAMKRDQDQWSTINKWAWESVRNSFILDNLDRGLIPETYDNSMVAIHLARAAYEQGAHYTVGTTQYGPLSPGDVEAAPYVTRLICGATYRMVDLKETPEGEYVVLAFPDENLRFDFFRAPGGENYVREVRKDEGAVLYKATFADGVTKASEVMQRWYWALAARRGA